MGKPFYYDNIVAFFGANLSLVAGILFLSTKTLIGESGSTLLNLGLGAKLCGTISIINAFVLLIYIFRKKIFNGTESEIEFENEVEDESEIEEIEF